MKDSKIAWTHHTFNPWTGCVKVSAGCVHCYAETLNLRWGKKNWGADAERTRTSVAYWKQPILWNKEAEAAGERRRVFCASMADVGEDRDDLIEMRRDLSILIEQTPHLDWLLLTKRPENMARLFERWTSINGGWPLNVWVGTSVEDQAAADKRIRHLAKIPSKVRFLSVEPMIGPVDLVKMDNDCGENYNALKAEVTVPPLLGEKAHTFRTSNTHPIDWVIVGGESGHGARPMDEVWARSIMHQSKEAGVAFFMKQLGGVRDKRESLEFMPEDLRVREYPA